MKSIFTLVLILLANYAIGKHTDAYTKLCEVNKCWTEQTDVYNLPYPNNTNIGEREWIRTHLQLVEQTLRNRSIAHLSETQKANRLHALNQLNSYWKSGAFPVNDLYNYRTPIFIDRYDNFCAVGYLVKATGHEAVSRKIAATTNLAYVREMNYPELSAWAKDYGFTVDELAWIQPGYPPVSSVTSVGNGTDGEVLELYANKTDDKLYVGGVFTKVDGNIPANNIAYVTELNGYFTWHSMADGVDGVVNAITEFDNKLFIGGSFALPGSTNLINVAYWDGSKWNAAGCIYGTVKDLLVYNNELYAVGDFDVCAAMSEVNFAKWDGTMWIGGYALVGHVNTVHPSGDDLIIGGSFSYMGEAVNIISYNAVNGFVKYAVGIPNEVNDIHEHKGVLYAACKATADTTGMLRKLNKDLQQWDAVSQYIHNAHGTLSFNSLCSDGNSLLVGGDFYYYPMMGNSISNCAEVRDTVIESGNAFGVDSTINVMTMFKNKLYAGGRFDKPDTWGPITALNGIAYKKAGVNVRDINTAEITFSIYPNPAGKSMTITNNFNAEYFKLYDVSGRVVLSAPISGTTATAALKALAPGIYVAEIGDAVGNKRTQKVVIE